MFEYDVECQKCEDVDWSHELLDRVALETASRTRHWLAWEEVYKCVCNVCGNEVEVTNYCEKEDE
jgi:hypothetical protein